MIAFAAIGCCPALARAEAPPCDAAVTATATLTAVDQYARSGDPTLIASHRALLDVDFGGGAASASVDMQSVRFSSTAPGLREESGEPVFVASGPGPVEIRVSWEQEVLSGDELRRCSGSAVRTFTFDAPRPLRVGVSGGVTDFGNYIRTRRGFTGQIISLSTDLFAGRRSDFGDVTVRWRVRRGKAAYPAGPFQQAVLRGVDVSGRQVPLGAAGPLRLHGELFSFASRDDGRNNIARIVLTAFTRFKGNGGYEVQVLQRGTRLVRVRGTLRKCHKANGCVTEGRVESTDPLVTFAGR
ncbi:MAG: hypothetical protein AB1416_03080 [Actinomycetota bacterium]